MRGRRRYYEPEDLGRAQARRDAADPARRFYVYVLVTDYGHYVGHTAHVGRRLRQHRDGAVASTAGGNPSLAWTSGPRATRRDAARFEAAMKSLRDRRSPRFGEITGVAPVPLARLAAALSRRFFGRARSRGHRRRGPRRGWFARLLRRELRGILRSRRRRRRWAAIAVVAILLGAAVADSIGDGVF